MWVNRLVAILIAASIGLVALGDIPAAAEPGEPSEKLIGPMSDYTNLTSLGIVSVVLVFIVIKMLPDLHTKIADIPKTQATIFTEAISAIMDKSEKIMADLMERSEDREKRRDERFDAMMERTVAAITDASKSMAALQIHCSETINRVRES